MTVSAKTPEAERHRTEGPPNLSVEAIRVARATKESFPGFTGGVCHACDKTANFIADGSGWHCGCGAFNLDDRNATVPIHDRPDFGPSKRTIDAGMEDPPVDIDELVANKCCGCGGCDSKK